MRLIKVTAPEGKGDSVAKVAFSVEIDKVSRWQLESQKPDGTLERRDVVDITTSTPKAKLFIDALLASTFYNPDDFTISTRQPRAIISNLSLRELTKPFVEPAGDVLEELFQFSYITTSFVARAAIAAVLIAYGMIQQQILLLAGGLLVLPSTPLLLAVGFGIKAQIWKLVGQGALAFLTVTVLLFLCGAMVAVFSQPPLKYNDFNSLLAGFLISVVVGIGAGFANIDDAGQRQLIGFAATAQIALVPAWFGISAVFGFPSTAGQSEIAERAASFFVNTLTMIFVPLIVYTLSKAASGELKKIKIE